MSSATDNPIEMLMQLTKSEGLQRGKFKDFTQELTRTLCIALNAFKASFWLYRSKKDEFESIQSFDIEGNKASNGKAIEVIDFPKFAEQLKTKLLLHVDNNTQTEELGNFADEYLLKNRLGSWVGMQVWNENKLFGILCIEWKSKKDFGDRDKLILTSAASMVSQCYDALMRLKEDFLHRNEVSTLKGEEKEKQKLAKKLSDHAFYTSHSIRHPLSTILALIDLIKLNWESREAYEELLQQLKIETMNLDDTIRVMTAKIELD